jgi:ferricrocin synthase
MSVDSTLRSLSRALNANDGSHNESGNPLAVKQRISALALKHKSFVSSVLELDPVQIEDSIYPCTPLQEGMIADGINRQTSSYFVTFKLAIAESIDLVKLQTAWAEAYKSLDILRVQFIQTDDGFLQVCQSNRAIPWHENYIENDEDHLRLISEFRSSWLRKNEEHLLQPFSVLSLRNTRFNYLVINIFHGLYDGNSFPLLLDRVRRIYSQDSVERSPQFTSVLAHGPLSSRSDAKDFWKMRLSPTWSSLPTKGLGKVSSGVSCSVTLPYGGELESSRRRLNVTHQAIVQTCWSTVLQNSYGGRICVGLITSGRAIDYEGADTVIGPMFNTLLFQPEYKSQDTWTAAIRRTHDFNVAALPFQHTPLRDVMKWLAESNKQLQPLDNIFTFQVITEVEIESTKNYLWRLVDEPRDPFYPLAFEAELHPHGTLVVKIVADSLYMDQIMLNSLLEEFIQAMSKVLEDPQTIISITEQPLPDISSLRSISKGDISSETAEFKWTDGANIIREEVARLASVDASEVTERLSIFELGLDSIDVIKLSSRLSHHGMNLKVSTIMQNPSVAEMVKTTENQIPELKGNEHDILKEYEILLEKVVQIPPDLDEDIERLLPATPLQEAMYSEMINSGFQRYYNHDVLKIHHNVDTPRLAEAWASVIEANPILRTAFISVEDPSVDFTFIQAVLRPGTFRWNAQDIGGTDMIPQLLDDITLNTEKNRGAILPRLTLVYIGSEQYLILSIPHALYDGHSIDMIHEDVRKAYSRLELDHPGYDSVLEEILIGSGPTAASFWKSYLSSAPICSLTENPAFSGSSESVHRKELTSSIALSHILQFCKAESVTLHHLTQTCYSLLLAAYTSTLEVVYALVLSGRNTEESQNVVFPTMNTVAFRSIIHGSYREMLRQTQHDLSNILLHLHFPLRKALSSVHRRHQRLFNSMFLFQSRRNVDDSDALPTLYDSVGGHSDVEFSLCVEAEVVNNSLTWRTACRGNLMDSEHARRLLHGLDDILRSIMSNVTSESFNYSGKVIRIANLPPFELYTAEDEEKSKINDTDSSIGDVVDASRLNTIRSVLSEVSKVPETEISLSSSLFQLGLDSISAIKLSSILFKRGVRISVSSMMREPTLSAISRNATDASETRDYPALSLSSTGLPPLMSDHVQEKLRLIGLSNSDVENFAPASAGQVYFLSTWRQSEGTLFYPTFIYRSIGPLSRDSIQSAWYQLVRHNAILRTIFISLDEPDLPYLQVRLKTTQSAVYFDHEAPENDLTHLSQPFVSLHAHEVSLGDWEFRLTIHHALYDGVSLPTIMQQLQSLLNNSTLNETEDDTAFDHSLWTLQSPEATKSSSKFWESYLNNLTTTTLQPAPSASVTWPRFEIFTPSFLPTINPLLTTARKANLSTQSLILAIYAKAYAKHTNNPESAADVLIAIYLANRANPNRPGQLTTTSPTVNIVPLRIRASVHSSVEHDAAQIQADLAALAGEGAEGMERAGVSLGQLATWTQGKAKVETVFNFLSLPAEEEEEEESGDGKVRVRAMRDEVEKARATVFERPEQVSGRSFAVPREMSSEMSLEAYSVCF